MTVATTILAQLGGRRFIACTGTRDFIGGEYSLKMTLPKNKSKANRLLITLDSTDTYTVEFFKYRPASIRVNHKAQTATVVEEKSTEIKSFSGIYCDQLQEIFEQVTGYDLSFCRVTFGN